MGIHDRIQAHGIVKPGLYMARSVGRRPVKITDPNGNRLCAAFKIRAYRCREHTELILIRRFHADNRIRAKQVRPDIEGCPGAKRRNIRRVLLHNLPDRLHKPLLRECRHLKACRRIGHPLCIKVRAESHDAPVLRRVSLKPFKACLGILQHTCTLVDHHI